MYESEEGKALTGAHALSEPWTQAAFGSLVGISQQAVSELVRGGVLDDGRPCLEWLRAYCGRLREQAAGRAGSIEGGLDLVQERAGLARAQREAQELKNAVARGQFAPVGLLSDVLALASSAVVDRMDQLEGALRKACPDLPEPARQTVLQVMASARNAWVGGTAALIDATLDDAGADDDDGAERSSFGADAS